MQDEIIRFDAAMTLFRGIADDRDLMDWLNHFIFPAVVQFFDELLSISSMNRTPRSRMACTVATMSSANTGISGVTPADIQVWCVSRDGGVPSFVPSGLAYSASLARVVGAVPASRLAPASRCMKLERPEMSIN